MVNWDKDYTELPVTWERGLLESVEDSMLPVGAAARLRNWVSQPSGNLQVRPAWAKASVTSAPGTRKGVGIGHFAMQRRPYVRQSATGTTASGSDPRDVSATWPAATLDDSLLIARVYVTQQGVGGTISVTPPAGWTLAKQQAGGGIATVAILYKEGAASESGAQTFNVSIAGFVQTIAVALEIAEVRNVVTSSALDQTAGADNTTSTSPVSGTTAVQTIPVGIAIAAFVDGDSTDNTFTAPTNGYTKTAELYVDNGTIDVNAAGSYFVYETTAAQSTGFTDSAAPTQSAAAIATFKAADYGTTDGVMLVANNEDPSIKVYYIDRDDLAAGTWNLLESVTAPVAASPIAFTSGNEVVFYTHISFDAVHAWAGIGATPAAVTGSPAGRCVAWHKNRLFVGGTLAEPWKLHFSEFGDHTTWNSGSATFIEVGKGDGEAIEDITPFQDGLLIGKQTSAYFLTGGSPDTFRLIRLPVGGVAPGRTVLSTQFGGILAGRETAWLFDGSNVGKMTEPVRDSYGMTGDWMSVSYVDDKASICDQGSGTVWTFDFLTQTWGEEIVGSAGTEGPSVVYNQAAKQFFAPKNASVGSLLAYRSLPGETLAKDFDTLSETFEAWTPEFWLAGPSEKITPRYLYLKLRQRNGDSGDTALTITPYYDGTSGTAMTVTPSNTPTTRWYRKSFDFAGSGTSYLQLRFTQTVPNGEAACFDIEEVIVGYNRETVA